MFGAIVRIGLAFAAGAGAEAAVRKVVRPETRAKFTSAANASGAALRGLGSDLRKSVEQVGEYVDRHVRRLDDWFFREEEDVLRGRKLEAGATAGGSPSGRPSEQPVR